MMMTMMMMTMTMMVMIDDDNPDRGCKLYSNENAQFAAGHCRCHVYSWQYPACILYPNHLSFNAKSFLAKQKHIQWQIPGE